MQSILLLGFIAIASSVATEIVTAINAKLNNTVLKGDGAFLLSAVVALVIAAGKVALTQGVDFSNIPGFVASSGVYFSQVWTVSQIFFMLVYQKLGLDISSTVPTSSSGGLQA